MITRLEKGLPQLIEFLQELGVYQLRMQGKVRTRSKSQASVEQAWTSNAVFSEVDVTSEERLLAYCRRNLGVMPVISEELNSGGESAPAGQEFTLVVDPLDGTKPYLEGKRGFGISLGLLHEGRFAFGLNYYPAFDMAMYSFTDAPGVMDQNGDQLPVPRAWTRECYVAVGFDTLLHEDHRHAGAIEAATGVRVADYDRCATYIFKRLIEGQTFAYLSIEPYIWDLGPSSLLLEKSGCGMFDLSGKPVDFAWLSRPPYCQPGVAALPVAGSRSFLESLRPILASAGPGFSTHSHGG